MVDVNCLRAELMDYIGSSYIPVAYAIVAEIESCDIDRLLELADYFGFPLN